MQTMKSIQYYTNEQRHVNKLTSGQLSLQYVTKNETENELKIKKTNEHRQSGALVMGEDL